MRVFLGLGGDYDNKANYVLPTTRDSRGAYLDQSFILPTVTLPSARRTMGNHRHAIMTGGPVPMGCGMRGVVTPATWQGPRFLLSGMRGDYNSAPDVISSLTPIVQTATATVSSGGNWISNNPGKTLAGLVLGYFLFKKK